MISSYDEIIEVVCTPTHCLYTLGIVNDEIAEGLYAVVFTLGN
jgi:hypothetical protein